MRIVMLPVLVGAVLGCAEPVEEDEGRIDQPVAMTSADAPANTLPLVPGVVSETMRSEANLVSDLGCVFRRGEETLLAAAANSVSAESAEALIVLDGNPVELEMNGGGGYNTLSRGASFAGPDGLEVEVEVRASAPVSETPAPVVAEPNFTGSLNLRRGSQTVTLEGIYNCGIDAVDEPQS